MCEGYNKILKEGKHYLTAVFTYAYKGWESDGDGVILMLDGDIYYCYENPDDGYRSYVKTIELAGLGQPLLKQFEYDVDISRYVSGQNEINYDILIQYEGKNIFECYTDNSDNYYPVGNIEYHGFQ